MSVVVALCCQVYKTGVTHCFSIDRASTELGYCPSVQNDMDSVLQWYIDRRHHRVSDLNRTARHSVFISRLFLLVVLIVLLLSWLPLVD